MDEGPSSTPRCAIHPEAAVAGTCARCGRFCCEQCLGGAGLCATCAEAAAKDAAERRLFLLLRGLAVGEVVRAVLICGLVFVARSSVPLDQQRLIYIAAAATALPFVGLAVAIWTSGRRWLSWLALALDVVVFGSMALKVTGQPLLTAALLALPVGMLVRVIRIQRLARAKAARRP